MQEAVIRLSTVSWLSQLLLLSVTTVTDHMLMAPCSGNCAANVATANGAGVTLVVVSNKLQSSCYTEDSCRRAIIDSCQKQLSQISFHTYNNISYIKFSENLN